jgi:hypothetical protein
MRRCDPGNAGADNDQIACWGSPLASLTMSADFEC